ncbi:MAG: isoprenyl transferase [Candidatus Marinimicrobia bacterium]|nr:isoprenyl transferase [Candidatus Neomarinimicrobiota bacterium]|tara:strand:- start:17610 stop:18371 length:762 start_codon:yes stop_codon:yes gene_type:complete
MKLEDQIKQDIKKGGNIPNHIAIIMDGNGRWAKNKGLPRIAGHKEGINSVREITRVCGELDVNFLTLYTFSKENWLRPRVEVSALMNLLVDTIRHEINELMQNNVRLRVIGKMEELPEKPRVEMEEGIRRTASNSGLTLILALNYSGRVEILEAVSKLIALKNGNEKINLTQEFFEKQLYTNGIPDPDLVVRTSGESRLSNFLLWQIAYSEIVITSTLWPAFRRIDLYKAILEYQSRERRYGKISRQVKGMKK